MTSRLEDAAEPAGERERVLADALDFIEAQEYAGTEIYNDQRIAICLDCGAEKGNPHAPGGCWWLDIMLRSGRRHATPAAT